MQVAKLIWFIILVLASTGEILAKLSNINNLAGSTTFYFFLSQFELTFPLAEIVAHHSNNITAQCTVFICLLYFFLFTYFIRNSWLEQHFRKLR